MSSITGKIPEIPAAHRQMNMVDLPRTSCCVQANSLQERTDDIQHRHHVSPFLSLPPEIRNKIYGLVLLAPVSSDAPWDHHPPKTPGVADAVGTVRCGSFRKYTMGFHVSILRANRQIYREAWGTFQLGNFWTLVQVNKVGFGEEMRALGFPIATVGDLSRQFRFPVLKVGIVFPSLEGQGETGTWAVATVHMEHLVRCLWTCKGASEMEVTIHVQPRITTNRPHVRHLLRPFYKLRGVLRITVVGSDEKCIRGLTRIATTTDGMDQTFVELGGITQCLLWYVKNERWDDAAESAEKHLLLMGDCDTVYGIRFFGCEHGLMANVAIERSRKAQELSINGAIAVAEVNLHLGQFANAVSFASRAIDLMTYASFLQANPANLFPNPLPFILTWNRPTRSFVHLIRAVAFMAMRQPGLAKFDIRKARDFLPNSSTLIMVCERFQLEFGGLSPF